MKKAYIILAHKNAEQVSRLITALDDNHSTFFLHLDEKADASSFRCINKHGSKVVAVNSVPTPWGGFGLVEATLQGIRATIEHEYHFDFVSLISGQHYPIKSNQHIHEFLCNTKHRIFLEYSTIPNYERWNPRGGLYRIDRYFLGLRAHERYQAKTLNFLLQYFDYFKRKFPENMQPYAGSQWWTMDYYTLKYILQFAKSNEDYIRFYKQTFAPDELFFHNILLNAQDEEIKRGITNNNLLYMNWTNKEVGHPEVLTCFDFKNIIASDALFARKFDASHDAAILDMIDEHKEKKIFVLK